MSDEPELIADRFRFEKPLGSGGFGEVIQAFDTKLHRHVAVKLLRPGINLPIEDMLVEAQRSAKLEHTNIVTVFDVEEHCDGEGDELVIVMQLLHGGSVGQRLELGPLPPTVALRWVDQALAGLAHAHENTVIHRDIKPSNFLLDTSDTLKLGDFGAAFDFTAIDPNALYGITYEYSAPERHIGGMPRDHRMDLWSIGISLFEMLAGEMPFAGQGQGAVQHVMNDAPSTLAAVLEDDTFEAVDRVILRLLEKRPDDRYATANDVRAALAPLLDRDWVPSARVPKLKPQRMVRVFWITHDNPEALERVVRLGLIASDVATNNGHMLREMSRGDIVLHALDGALVAVGDVATFPTSSTQSVNVAVDAILLDTPLLISDIPLASRQSEPAKHGGPFNANGAPASGRVSTVSRAFLSELIELRPDGLLSRS